MRLGEIHALKWDCVDFTGKQITVKRTYCLKEDRLKEKTKTKRIRRIPINEPLLKLLRELRARGTSEYVLFEFDYEHAGRTVRRLSKKAKVKSIRFHDLRHTFASNFLMNGGSIYKLQRILGHSTIAMTERYSHLSPEHLNGATEMLDFGTLELATVIAFQKRSKSSDEKNADKMPTKQIVDEKIINNINVLNNRGGGN